MTRFAIWRRAARDRDGTVAVEFAFVLPILLTLFFGSFELSNLALAYLKLTDAAETAADLVAQTDVNQTLQAADFTNITNAAEQVLTPLSTGSGQLQAAYASVTYNTGSPVVDWHVEENGAAPIAAGAIPNGQDLTQLGVASPGSTDSVVIVQLQYSYTSPLSFILSRTYTLTKAAFNRPRNVDCVPTYLKSPCP
jgi:Flp pilus assembly protein TadG